MLYHSSSTTIKNQRKKYLESIESQEDRIEDEVENETQIKARIEELNQRFLEEDSARTLIVMRYASRIFWLLYLVNLIMPLASEFWDALSANRTLGRTYQLLTLLSFIFIVVSFLFDIFLLFKFFSTKQLLTEEEDKSLFRFTHFSQRLKKMKFVRFFTLFFSVSSVLLLISSQILLWGFIVW